MAWGEMREDGYLISLDYSEFGVEAFAAGFSGHMRARKGQKIHARFAKTISRAVVGLSPT